MRPFFNAIALGLLFASASETFAAPPAPENVSSLPPRTPAEEVKAFHLPPGFVAELVAAEPDIHKPMNIAFDDLGRLWVTDTLEYPFAAAVGTKPRDTVKILSDFGPDGRARKIQTFADGLNIPIGVLPMPGGRSALVHGIPHIQRLTDTDGDGKADKREPLYQTYGFRDTHGMTNSFTWGVDGWIYATHGFSNESKVSGSDQQAIVMQSGNTYRMRPDGSHLEFYSHGQVNPFGLCFDPLGNLYSSDCHSRPVYQLLRGAYYPSFGKPDDGLGFGPEMAFHDHGSTGIAGIIYYAAQQFPKDYLDRVMVGNVVTSRINQDTIEWHGSTPKALEQPDFLVSDDPWFRPVDLEVGPDGALYVADFYNRIIGHYEVPLTHPGRDRERGRIWRISYPKTGIQGNARLATCLPAADADPETAGVNGLVVGLASPDLAVRTLTANRMAASDKQMSVALLESFVKRTNSPPLDRNHPPAAAEFRGQVLWLLERTGRLQETVLTFALHDSDRLVRVHALKIVGERAEVSSELMDKTRKALTDEDAFVRRAAAEALARHPGQPNVWALLALRPTIPIDDTHLIHAVRIALRDQLRSAEAWRSVSTSSMSLRQIEDLADVAPGVPSAAAANFLYHHVTGSMRHRGALGKYVHHIARYADLKQTGQLLAFLRGLSSNPKTVSLAGGLAGEVELLKEFQQGLQERGAPLGEDGRSYAESLVDRILEGSHPQETLAAVNLAGSLRLIGTREKLVALAKRENVPEGQRLEALSAVAAIDPKGSLRVLSSFLVDARLPLSARDRAATLLATLNQPEAQAALLAALPSAPERVQSAIAAGLAARKPGAESLLDAIAAGKASARLLQENRVAGPLANAGISDVQSRLAKLLKGLPPADQKINALIASRRAGFSVAKVDADAGAKVFEASCASCHQLNGKGAKVGPQLDGIGLRGLDRILEDVLDPGRNVDQTFRASALALKDGRVVSGLLLREEGAVLVIADAQGKEVRVPVDTVEERTILPLSPMPANFTEQVPEADFYRLIAYLLSQRPKE